MDSFPIAEMIGAPQARPQMFFFCDHASSAIPEAYDGLGLAPDMLGTHIAVDVGAGALTRALCEAFDAPGLLCGFSRLLIDPNRSRDRIDLIPPVSDGVRIPGNEALSPGDRHERITRFFDPYHERLGCEIAQCCAGGVHPLIVSVHSFTRRLNAEPQDRPWQAGVLWRHDPVTAQRLMGLLRQRTDWSVGDNQPYDARVFNYSVDRHVAPIGAPHVTLEIRQDLIDANDGVAETAELLKQTISALVSER